MKNYHVKNYISHREAGRMKFAIYLKGIIQGKRELFFDLLNEPDRLKTTERYRKALYDYSKAIEEIEEYETEQQQKGGRNE